MQGSKVTRLVTKERNEVLEERTKNFVSETFSKKKKKKKTRRRTGRDRPASHAGHAAKVAERRKRQKYRPACDQLGLGFMPLAIENDGTLGKELQAFIRRCNEVALRMPIAGTTWAASSFGAYWRQRISVCLRRGEARAAQRCLLANCSARSGGCPANLSDFVNPQSW